MPKDGRPKITPDLGKSVITVSVTIDGVRYGATLNTSKMGLAFGDNQAVLSVAYEAGRIVNETISTHFLGPSPSLVRY
jgi:hypothetical protein